MPFPSSSNVDLITAWSVIRSAAGTVKKQAQNLDFLSASGDIEASYVTAMSIALADALERLAQYSTVPGLAAYAQQQTGTTVDIVAEYQALVAEIEATRDWIVGNFPKDSGGYLAYSSFDANGRVVIRKLTSAQTAGLRSRLAALIARID